MKYRVNKTRRGGVTQWLKREVASSIPDCGTRFPGELKKIVRLDHFK